MKIYKSISELIGNTPLVELKKLKNELGLYANIYAKLEYFNPAGSVKDRIAMNMIESAEREKKLLPGGTIIEPTSGNTGIGIAAIAASRGYKAIIVMPDTMSVERRKLISAYGAQIILTDGAKGMKGAIERAEEIAKATPNSIIAGQFSNPDNPETHLKTTGPEIWEDTDGNIDIFVAGIGTGGTISGVGCYLKNKNNNIKVVGIEPALSPFISKGIAGPHNLQGIGAGFIPKTLDTAIIDDIITVYEQDAYAAAREITRSEGYLVGISSGAALYGAIKLAKIAENKDKNIIVILPDTGERYLSTELFA